MTERWQTAFLMAFGAGFVAMWFVLPVRISVIIMGRIVYGMMYPRPPSATTKRNGP